MAKLKESGNLCCPNKCGNSFMWQWVAPTKRVSIFLARRMAMGQTWGMLQKAHRN